MVMVPTQLNNAWEQFVAGCGSEAPCRTRDDLGRMVLRLPLGYWIEGGFHQPAGATEDAWGLFWEAVYETGWAWDPAVPDEAVIDYFEQRDPNLLLTAPQAAAELGVHRDTTSRAASGGEVPGARLIGRAWAATRRQWQDWHRRRRPAGRPRQSSEN